jgi:tetratricopeptide (TPR) repeat protein
VWVPVSTVVATVIVAAVAAIVTNYATVEVPDFFRDRWRAFLALAVLALIAVVLELVALWPRREAAPVELALGAATPSSLRRPAVGVTTLRGRESELAQVMDRVSSPCERFVVICGAGGMGKTTLAEVMAERAERSGRSVFWIRWRDGESLAVQMVAVACALGLPATAVDAAQKSGASVSDLVWRHLSEVRRWVLVLDNIDSPESSSPGEPIAAYRGWIRPAKTGLLVTTSRDRSSNIWGSAADLVDLSPLSPREGGQALLDMAPHAGPLMDAEALAARLGGLPLALHATGTVLAQPTTRFRSFTAYSDALSDKSTHVLPARPDATDRDTARTLVGHTWELSLDQLAENGHPLARFLLRALSLLAEAPIPLALITPTLITKSANFTTGAITRTSIDTTLAELHRHGLVDIPDPTRFASLPTVALHPLVRETNRLLLMHDPVQDFAKWQQAVDLTLLAITANCLDKDRPTWPLLNLLIPHLLTFPSLDGPPTANIFHAMCDILENVANQLVYINDTTTEVTLRKRFLHAEKIHVGGDNVDILISQNNLANALQRLGHYQEAADLHHATLNARRHILGDDHPDTLSSQNNLASTLSDLGHHQKAADLHRDTLNARRHILGDDHPDTLSSQNNLASTLSDLGHHQKAADLHHTTLDSYRRTLGDDHPHTLSSQSNLAAALADLGHHQKAADLHRDTLNARRRTLGEDHPDTLISQNNLASTLAGLGHLQEAADLLHIALDICRRTLGDDHPSTVNIEGALNIVQSHTNRKSRRVHGFLIAWRRHPR